MSRRRCCGRIDETIVCQTFIPEGYARWPEIIVQLEELEAIRLKDKVGMDQVECAASMGVSRATFQRILGAARSKIAIALTEGRPIIIQGGNYTLKNRVFECIDCRHVWEAEPCSKGGKHGYEIACPQCGSMRKMRLDNGVKHPCSGQNGQVQGDCCDENS
jgi:Predicted DNA-binding proteins